jgi:hypothetical protein
MVGEAFWRTKGREWWVDVAETGLRCCGSDLRATSAVLKTRTVANHRFQEVPLREEHRHDGAFHDGVRHALRVRGSRAARERCDGKRGLKQWGVDDGRFGRATNLGRAGKKTGKKSGKILGEKRL